MRRRFFIFVSVAILLMAALSQTQTVCWGSEFQITLPNAWGDSFSVILEKDCWRRSMTISGFSKDRLEKTITVRCPSDGADSVRIVLGNYDLPMTMSFGRGEPIYYQEIFKMPHIVKSGIDSDSINIAIKFNGEPNVMIFINELAYKRDGKWVVHHDFTIPSFSNRPTNEGLVPVTATFLQNLVAANATKVGEKTSATYRFLACSTEISHGDTLFFTAFGGEKAWGVVYPAEEGANDLTCQVIWNYRSAYLATYFENTSVYLAKKSNQTVVNLKCQQESGPGLFSNYPNPFNSSTIIKYDLVNGGYVTMAIYNIKGQEVARLVDGNETAGSHSVSWSGVDQFGNNVPSGVYVCLIRAGDFVEKLQMTLLK